MKLTTSRLLVAYFVFEQKFGSAWMKATNKRRLVSVAQPNLDKSIMAKVEQRTHSDHAKMWSTIDEIVLSLDRFNEKLSDDRKIRLFTMSREDLTKLARDVDGAPARMKAISLIVAAITATEQRREEEKELALGTSEPSVPPVASNRKKTPKPANKKRSSAK